MKKSIIVFGVCCLLSFNASIRGQDHEDETSKIKFESNEVQSLLIGSDVVSSTKRNYVEAKVKLNYPTFDADLNSYANRQELIKAGKEYHSKNNKKLFEKLKLDKYEDIFIDNYAPFIWFTDEWRGMDAYINLAKNQCVSEIVLGITEEASSKLTYATNAIGVKSYIDNGTYTGTGVTVGILETGIVDSAHANFNNTNLVIRDELLVIEKKSSHATLMASIITKIAPNAKLLSAQLNGNPASAINWFLDNDVTIINMSYGELDPTGIYSSESAYVDYITTRYHVLFVAAAGNDGGNVCNPGLAYNAICVGSSEVNEKIPMSFSAYQVVQGSAKPNILTPGYLMSVSGIDGVHQGTSVSTAIMTGSIALLMQAGNVLMDYPDRVLALVYANSDVESYNFENGVIEGIGAGRLNFGDCINNRLNYIRRYINFTNNFNYAYPIELTAGDEITISLAWMVESEGTVSSLKFTNFDLKLRDKETNEIVSSSTSTTNNVEIIRHNVTKTGQYYIDINQIGTQARKDMLSMYYRIR